MCPRTPETLSSSTCWSGSVLTCNDRGLQQVQREHRDLGVLAVGAGEVGVPAVEDHAVGVVPVLDDPRAGVDVAPQRGLGASPLPPAKTWLHSRRGPERRGPTPPAWSPPERVAANGGASPTCHLGTASGAQGRVGRQREQVCAHRGGDLRGERVDRARHRIARLRNRSKRSADRSAVAARGARRRAGRGAPRWASRRLLVSRLTRRGIMPTRSASAPLASSQNTRAHPGAANASSCNAGSCSAVDTRA